MIAGNNKHNIYKICIMVHDNDATTPFHDFARIKQFILISHAGITGQAKHVDKGNKKTEYRVNMA